MVMKNKVKQLLELRGVSGYALHKETGIALTTVYRLINEPHVIPTGEVMDIILNHFPDTTVADLLEHQRTQ